MGHLLGAVSAIGLLPLVLISLGRVGRILRLPYEHWLFLHRLTGLLLLSALLHCWFLDLIIDGSTPLLAIYVTMATIDLTLTPTGETTLPVTGGQFVYLRVGGWHEHPFSGGPRQVWIAGGIGIAPFLGWLTHPGAAPPRTGLFYCAPTAEDAPFLPELTAARHTAPSSGSTRRSAAATAV
ncbi:ferredoxin reductase domain-containing protein [Streptomyces niveus]|uniref:hypothetical protein n=1 Tax=Streptomyces niveus TaxID=193462 RepID=UPI0036D1309A